MSMLRDVLADQFKLVLHHETRENPAFILEVAKSGPKLEKAVAGESSTNTSTTNSGVIIEAHNIDMDSFAKVLSRKLDLPVVNNTELLGIFNLKVYWTPDNARRVDGAGMEGPSIFTAIQDQLGLRLRSEKTSVEILVIDHAEKPSAN